MGVRVRVNPRARRMALRVDPRDGDVVLTWPVRGSVKAAEKFIGENTRWIEERRQKRVSAQLFADGMTVTVYGRPFTITHTAGRGLTRFDDDKLIVHGQPEHLPRRVRDFLKDCARSVIEEKAGEKLEQIGRLPKDIRIIDPKSRWGSCSPDGSMMFSWRLVLTPPFVLDYVVAHEVAHCTHMNHGKKFWALCDQLAEDMTDAKRWLKTHGTTVMAYQ